jgi:hypothetical protein
MTPEPTPAPAVAEPEAPAAETAPEAPAEETPASDALAAARREAADRRVKLKAAEEANAQLAAKVEQLQRAEVERLAAATLAAGADLFLDGAELASFLDEETGDVSPDAVSVAAAKIVEARPGLARPAGSGFDGGARRRPAAPAPTFAESLKNAVGR